ncbi:MAG: hypothetical protein KAR19_02530 [Bacteroidales bacterium]|nr:hypothetical protein [Bacteroidales bacterium]
MKVDGILQKLKRHWSISNSLQVLVILIVFALAGFSTLFIHRQINTLLEINQDSSFWLRLLVFIVLILPLYTVILYIYGIVLGQRKFSKKFIKTKLGLIFRKNAGN